MRTLCALVVALVAASCSSSSSGLFRQYEYEEEMYLSIDGGATLYVNSSIPALNALRGTSFDPRPRSRVDREAVRRYFGDGPLRVVRVSTSRRGGRQFVHVRLAVDDVRALGGTAPFNWSSYAMRRAGEVVVYEQQVGAAAPGAAAGEAWSGDELVAFRIHVPSVVEYHNAGPDNLRRGNILVWEQRLADRLRGAPLALEVRMQPQSILYRTLILFAAMIAAAALVFGGVIWWVVRKGRATR